MKHLITGKIRISILSENLLRIEKEGKTGFEDRPTFLAVNREWPGTTIKTEKKDNKIHLKTKNFTLIIPEKTEKFKDIKIYDRKENLLSEELSEDYSVKPLPRKGKENNIYILPDKGRVIPPPRGGLPPPHMMKKNPLYNVSGWELNNKAPDIYIFIYNKDLKLLKKEFLKLTGKIPLPPLWTFGFWNSRYHPYSDKEAIETIKKYRTKDIPLDVFVVDTDWRVGGSTGYDIEKKYFPNIEEFFKEAHNNNVKVVMNDHPGPRGMKPVEPAMLKYRYENLTEFISMGLDTWWYDKNWYEFIEGPVAEIPREVWGQYLYSEIISHKMPGMRTVLLSMWSDHPASHRYPLWWTGDIHSTWDNLRDGIKETLWFGEQSMPFVGQDLGGHIGDPDDELYVRFLQYGCLSPTARVHGSIGTKRYPWLYSKETENIVRKYIKLRYRLLPEIYSSARLAYEEGTPILEHVSSIWPDYEKSNDYLEYIFCKDILAAPVYTQEGWDRPDKRYVISDDKPGFKGEYFPGPDLKGKADMVKTDEEISFPGWTGRSSGYNRETFSVRWTGVLKVPEKGTYTFRTISSDGVRLWVDKKLLIDNWESHREAYDTADIELEGGTSVSIKLEFYNKKGFWIIRLDWSTPASRRRGNLHKLWIPPGEWEDLWTGEIQKGPKELEVNCPLHKIPLYAKRGSIILTGPEMNYSGEKPWNPVTAEIFPPLKGKVRKTLYEDDGTSLEYKNGGFKKTEITAEKRKDKISVKIGRPEGYFTGAEMSKTWIVKIHLREKEKIKEVFIDGKKTDGFSVTEKKDSWPLKEGSAAEIVLVDTKRERKIIITGLSQNS